MNTTSSDVSKHIFSFLCGRDLVLVGQTAKRHLRGSRTPALWLKLVREEPFGASCIASAEDGIEPATFGWRRLQLMYASATAASALRSPVWARCRAAGATAPRSSVDNFGPGAQEGHTSALLDDRYWITIGGYGERGIANDVGWLDTRVIENPDYATSFDEIAVPPLAGQTATFSECSLQDGRQHYPTPVYGHTACSVAARCIAMVGGVRFGGYRGDVNELHYLHFDSDCYLHVEGPGHLRWAVGPPLETSRAYCSLSVVTSSAAAAGEGRGRFLVAFGGLHRGSACNSLEFLSLASLDEGGVSDEDEDEDEDEGARPRASGGGSGSRRRSSRSPRRRTPAAEAAWHTPATSGAPPPPRFGHTAHWHAHSSTLFVVGGSTGSDLLRDGSDHYASSLHLLAVNALRWSTVPVEGDAAPRLAGRCHAACAWGDVESATILVFGGSRRVTNALGVLRVDLRAARRDRSVAPAVTCERLDMRYVEKTQRELSFDYRYILRESCSQFDSLPLTSLTILHDSLRRGTSDADIEANAAACVVGRVSAGRGRADAASTRPGARLSHTGVLAGRNFLVYGGWNRSNLGDTYALHLDAAPVSLAQLEPTMFSSGDGSRMPRAMHGEGFDASDDEEDGGWFDGDDDDDDDDGDDVTADARRRMQQQLLQFIALQAQRGDAEGDAEGRCAQQ